MKPYDLLDSKTETEEEIENLVDTGEEKSSNDLNDIKSCDQGSPPGSKSSHRENVASCGDSGNNQGSTPGSKSSYKENVASCRDSGKQRKQVMMEDGLRDVEALHTLSVSNPELEKDVSGARCL